MYIHYTYAYDGFDWDPAKDAANRAKHGVGFDEAASAFEDARGMITADPDHSTSEDRFVLLGFSGRGRLLVVVHCWRKRDELIRIISARCAHSSEARHYVRRR